MRGVNVGCWSGNIGTRVIFSTTSTGDEYCAFDLVIEGRRSNLAHDKSSATPITNVTWVRVNVFSPGLIAVCRSRLTEGCYVQVAGALMNRRRALEVRAEQLVFGGAPAVAKQV